MNSLRRHLSDRFGVGYFIAPWPLIAVVILIFNDHYLKRSAPSFVTGKLSDLAGVFFFPIFLCAVWNLLNNAVSLARGEDRFRWISIHQGAIAILLTDLIFAGVKMFPTITYFYLEVVASIGFPSVVTRDPSDLAALVMNLFTYWYIAYEDYCSSR